jgi:hypothetical protein
LEISTPERAYTVEPLEDPVPRVSPERAELAPADAPIEPARGLAP